MTPSGIEPATFRFVGQYINHCATAVPIISLYVLLLTTVNNQSHYRPEVPRRFQEVTVPRLSDNGPALS